MKGFRHLCQTFCLSWSTVITWTPGLRRPEQAEMSSTLSMGAAWRTFTPSFTMGYTVISTRLVLSPLLHVRAVPLTCKMQHNKDSMELLSFVVQWLWKGCEGIRVVFLLAVSRTQCLERGHTSPVTSAWLSSTAPTAVAGRKASWVLCSAVLPCVKSLITQMLSARWRKKVRWSWNSLTQTLKHTTLMFKPSPSMICHFRFRNHWPSALQSKEQRGWRSPAEVLCRHQQSAFESQVPACVLSEEAPVQVSLSQFTCWVEISRSRGCASHVM